MCDAQGHALGSVRRARASVANGHDAYACVGGCGWLGVAARRLEVEVAWVARSLFPAQVPPSRRKSSTAITCDKATSIGPEIAGLSRPHDHRHALSQVRRDSVWDQRAGRTGRVGGSPLDERSAHTCVKGRAGRGLSRSIWTKTRAEGPRVAAAYRGRIPERYLDDHLNSSGSEKVGKRALKYGQNTRGMLP